MGKQSRKRKEIKDKKQGWLTATLVRFGEPNEFGEVFTSDTQFMLPDGTLMEKGIWYNIPKLNLQSKMAVLKNDDDQQ